ncbi:MULTISPECIES: hypothetical protein [Rhizobium]|nr:MULTISPECIES: hypothetical protein [Rhizobium]
MNIDEPEFCLGKGSRCFRNLQFETGLVDPPINVIELFDDGHGG